MLFFYAENIVAAIALALESKYGKNHDKESIRGCRIITVDFNLKGKSNWSQARWHKERIDQEGRAIKIKVARRGHDK